MTVETDEIEVTEEMFKAGVRALLEYSSEIEIERDAVARIYRAMRLLAVASNDDCQK